MRLGTEFYPKRFPSEAHKSEMQKLRDTWDQFAVDGLLVTLREKFEKPEQLLFYKAKGNEIAIARPFIMARSMRATEGGSHFDKSSKFEADWITDTVLRREYTLALNADGFFARFRKNRPLFLERPERINGTSGLQSLLEANISSERSRNPDVWFIWSDNTPLRH